MLTKIAIKTENSARFITPPQFSLDFELCFSRFYLMTYATGIPKVNEYAKF
jgi:hypothetical protein